MEESSLLITNFKDGETPQVDATDKADTEVVLSGASGSGSIIIGKYSGEPDSDVPFLNSISKGGTGKPSIKFVDVRVEGYTEGTALITVHYTDNEISNFNPDTLFLAYYSGNKWHRCASVSNSIDNHDISGEIPVYRLTGTLIGLGGDLLKNASNGAPLAQSGGQTGTGIPWSLAGIVIVPIVVIGIAIFIIDRTRRRNPVSN
jgi:hypothetical protein